MPGKCPARVMTHLKHSEEHDEGALHIQQTE